jgi:hypothetical protein
MDWKLRYWLKEMAWRRREIIDARSKLHSAVRDGTVKKEPCKCGSTKVEAHHMDYSFPLDVIWCCKKHHAELDKLKREIDGGIVL